VSADRIESVRIEYPDAAGYPDGMGFLDEGTAGEGAAPAPEVPSTDLDDEIAIVSDETSFRAMLGGREVAVMRIAADGDSRVVLRSTVVDASVRGRGIGTAFIADVLDDLRDARSSVVVQCPEVARFIERNPAYAELVA
jgi:uncharacterized protein